MENRCEDPEFLFVEVRRVVPTETVDGKVIGDKDDDISDDVKEWVKDDDISDDVEYVDVGTKIH